MAFATPTLAFLVRTRSEPNGVINAVRGRLKELEPLRAVYDVSTLPERIGAGYVDEWLRTAAFALFAGAALACLGAHGTLSYAAALRRREVWLRVVAVACVASRALWLAFSRVLSGILFGVSPFDAVTLVGIITLVTSVAIVAALVPALRAARVAPMNVLREG